MSYSSIGTDRATHILTSNGYNGIRINAVETNRIIYTNTKNFFLKNDTDPWFKTGVMEGPGMAVFANQFETYIKRLGLEWLYFWGEQNKLYHVDAKKFIEGAILTKQPDGYAVYVYPLNRAERWEVIPKSESTTKSGLDNYV